MESSIKTIGIITFHRSYNYGSALQAYALKEYLKKIGFYASVIDYTDLNDFEQYRLFRFHSYHKSPASFFSDIAFLGAHMKRKRNFELFAQKYMNLTPKRYYNCQSLIELNDQFDAFICGSDQIWNLDCTNGINPAFFLAFAGNQKRRIAYAPSLAHTSFKKDYSHELVPYLERIDFLSVREHESISYLEQIARREVKQVVDPTLLLEYEDYEVLIKSNVNKQKYLFVYMLEDNPKMIQYCLDFAKQNKLDICYLTPRCYFNIAGKNLYGISPNDFLSYLKNASYVITNSFHATVFSIIFKKKFVTFSTASSASRMENLLHILGIEDRLHCDSILKDIDFEDVDSKLKKYRCCSKQYLEDALR